LDSSDLVARWRFRVHRAQLAHYETARRLERQHLWLGILAIGLSAAVGTAVFASLAVNDQPWVRIVLGMFSVVAAVLSSLQTFLKSSDAAEKHRVAGAKLAHLKQEIELLSVFPPATELELKAQLAEIETRSARVRDENTNIPGKIWAHFERTFTFEDHRTGYPALLTEA
jgi:hypothetical protein